MCRISYMSKIDNILEYNKVDFFNKKVFIRCDFNCPLDKDGNITDDFRIKSSLVTLKFIINNNPKMLVILTHMGRPTSGDKNINSKLSTSKLVSILSRELKINVNFIKEGLDYNYNNIDKGVYLSENVRFHTYESLNTDLRNKIFEKNEVSLCSFDIDVFCNEAFSVSHRDHFTVTGLKYNLKCYGHCFLKELRSFDKIMYPDEKTNTLAIIGGSKVSDKIPMLENLSKKVDYIFIAGNNVNSYRKDPNMLDKFRNNKAKIIMMEDGFGGSDPKESPQYFPNTESLNSEQMLFDIGPISMNKLIKIIDQVKVIFWNGALGISEHQFYKNGSEMLLKYMNCNKSLNVIIGGGDTAGFVKNYNNDFYHISTGGGAAIEYIGKESLPALE